MLLNDQETFEIYEKRSLSPASTLKPSTSIPVVPQRVDSKKFAPTTYGQNYDRRNFNSLEDQNHYYNNQRLNNYNEKAYFTPVYNDKKAEYVITETIKRKSISFIII